MASTYEPIATTTLSGSQATITFSSIPATYTDLVLVVSATVGSVSAPYIQFNSDTGTNYSTTEIIGSGTVASSGRTTNSTVMYCGGWINGFPTSGGGNMIIQIMNYSNTTTYKTAISRFNSAGTEVEATVGLWRSTSAINRIDLNLQSGNTYSAGSTFTLYGVKAA